MRVDVRRRKQYANTEGLDWTQPKVEFDSLKFRATRQGTDARMRFHHLQWPGGTLRPCLRSGQVKEPFCQRTAATQTSLDLQLRAGRVRSEPIRSRMVHLAARPGPLGPVFADRPIGPGLHTVFGDRHDADTYILTSSSCPKSLRWTSHHQQHT